MILIAGQTLFCKKVEIEAKLFRKLKHKRSDPDVAWCSQLYSLGQH